MSIDTGRPEATPQIDPDLDVVRELSTQPAPQPRTPSRPEGPLPRRVLAAARRGWRQLTSMRTALLLLFLLALAAIPGSLLPQRATLPADVDTYFQAHPTLAPIFDRLHLFDVFTSPWFAAVYLLLFISLVGCLIPRIRLHTKALRGRPPRAPRHLDRLPHSARLEVDGEPAQVVARAAALLRSRRWRVEFGGDGTVAAEKGYLRETGNLIFHSCLVLLLVGIAVGALFGYKGSVLLTQGESFTNTRIAYDDFTPGRAGGGSTLPPFTLALQRFVSTYQPDGAASTFDGYVTWSAGPGQPTRSADIRVNHPLSVDGANVYLGNHGYAPHLVVRDAGGRVVFDASVPCLPSDPINLTSDCVVKVPDAVPAQLGFSGFLTPTTVQDPAVGIRSAFPGLRNPGLALLAWRGDLGLDSGVPQSVYRLDTTRLTRIGTHFLRPGQSWALPGGGSAQLVGVSEWVNLEIRHDPGTWLVLVAAVGIVAGLLGSLRVRRRRFWVRVEPVAPRRTVVAVGGLARSDADANAQEFDELVGQLGQPARSDGRPRARRWRRRDEE